MIMIEPSLVEWTNTLIVTNRPCSAEYIAFADGLFLPGISACAAFIAVAAGIARCRRFRTPNSAIIVAIFHGLLRLPPRAERRQAQAAQPVLIDSP